MHCSIGTTTIVKEIYVDTGGWEHISLKGRSKLNDCELGSLLNLHSPDSDMDDLFSMDALGEICNYSCLNSREKANFTRGIPSCAYSGLVSPSANLNRLAEGS